MILLKSIKLNNFLSHENTEINFHENEKLLLDGRSGSGKSSITEAVLWGLYGKGRVDNRSLVRRTAKTGSVSLKLSTPECLYVITRSVSTSGKNTLVVTRSVEGGSFKAIETTGLKDTQAWIEEVLLKASYELFTNSVAYPQENENSFVKANASRRKDLLLEIVRAGNFDELYEKTKKTISGNELDVAVTVSKIDNLEGIVKNAKEIADKYDSYKKEVDKVNGEIEGLTLIEKDWEKKSNDVSSIVRQISDKKSISSLIIGSIEKIDNQLEDDQKIVLHHKTVDISTARDNIKYADELLAKSEVIEWDLKANATAQQVINAHLSNKPSVFDYTKDIELINKRLIPLIKDTNKCPAGDKCPFIIPIQGQIDFLTEQITEKTKKAEDEKAKLEKWEKEYVALVSPKDTTELYKKLSEIRDQIKILSESRKLIVEYELFEKTLVDIQNREVKLKEERAKHSADLFELDTKIKELEESFAKVDTNTINRELSTIRIAIQDLQKVKDSATTNMTLATMAQKDIESSTLALVELKKTISKAKDDNESLELLKEALSPRGIKAVVIDYLVPQLEDRINNVLSQMSDFRIRLDTQRGKMSEEGSKEGLFINIINDQGQEMEFSSYSGGERIKITMAISEALASIMSSIGFRILDEAINSLDNESTQSFVEVLIKLQEKFPQVICISHLDAVKDIFEKRVIITKTRGVSNISE